MNYIIVNILIGVGLGILIFLIMGFLIYILKKLIDEQCRDIECCYEEIDDTSEDEYISNNVRGSVYVKMFDFKN